MPKENNPAPAPTVPAIAVHFNVPLPDGRVVNMEVQSAYTLRDSLNAIIGQYEAANAPPTPVRKATPSRKRVPRKK